MSDVPLPLMVGGAAVLGLASLYAFNNRQGIVPPKHFSYIVPDSADLPKGLGPIYRHPLAKDGLLDRFPTGERTMYETFQHGVKNFPGNPCLGHRPRVGTDEKGAPIVGGYVWQTYAEANTRARNFGSGLLNLDLVPVIAGTKVTGPMRMLALFLRNRPEWVLAEQGGFSQSVSTVPLYDTLGPDTVELVINETELTTVLLTPKEMRMVINAKRHCPSLKNLILTEKPPVELIQEAEAQGIKVHLFEDVEQSGKDRPQPLNPPTHDKIATFCYTSGTTGKCKGALLTHANILSDIVGVSMAGSMLYPTDRHLSYLPLAHSFERAVCALCFYVGARVGFSQGDPLRIPDDIQALRPTAFPSVPRLLNRVYDKVMNTVNNAGGVKAKLFHLAYASKLHHLRKGWLKHKLWDKLVFSKVAARTGLEQCRFIFVGSAPLAPHVQDFLRIVIGCPVIEGYGQTETSAGATTTHFADMNCGTVGQPMPCNEVRLVSVDNMQYKVTDTVHGKDIAAGNPGVACCGRGEICCRGPNIFKGYYKMEDVTAETLDSDGWVHTGDIGMWTPNGALRIIDRKKNIFKLSQGEYVAPEKVENVYAKCPYVAQSFVYGDSFQSQCVAIVVPEPDAVKSWAQSQGISGTFEELCKTPAVKKMIHEDMDRVRREAKLFGFEHAAAIYLDPNPFTMQNQMLTPTFKLVRDVAKKYYKEKIEDMYHGLEAVGGKKNLRLGS